MRPLILIPAVQDAAASVERLAQEVERERARSSALEREVRVLVAHLEALRADAARDRPRSVCATPPGPGPEPIGGVGGGGVS